ncbi:GEVED domain-containing protein [Wenyingzhuangia sp. IMCC45467]
MSIKYNINLFLGVILLFSFFKVNAQTNDPSPYCKPANFNSDGHYITDVTIGNIDNITTTSANSDRYTYFNNLSTDLTVGQEYTLLVTYRVPSYNGHLAKVWIDYGNDGDFSNAVELASYSGSQAAQTYNRSITFTVPSNASVGTARLRVMVVRNNIGICNTAYQSGETEDYKLNIKALPAPPVANCVGSLDVELDVAGNATITPAQINNGSTDVYDDANGLTLSYSLNKTTFNCNDLGANEVTLTVTDSDGLTDTCTAIVNVSVSSSSFVAPTLEPVNTYCDYTVVAPIMNYQCGQQITGTSNVTGQVINSNTTITWTFTNGEDSVTSNQVITFYSSEKPTGVGATNINKTSAKIFWKHNNINGDGDDDDDTLGPYKIRYRYKDSSGAWTNTTSANKEITITGLSSSTEYEVQVSIDGDCGVYSDLFYFTTTDLEYCIVDVNLSYSGDYRINKVDIGTIALDKNNVGENSNFYNDYTTYSTNLTPGLTFSGTVDYKKSTYNDTGFVVWVDFNQDGFFDDVNEKVYEADLDEVSGSGTVQLTDIEVPIDALPGQTRMRVAIKHNGLPTSSCNFDNQSGEIQDYKIIMGSQPTPVANCVGNLEINLDISGEATITADDIDDGSTNGYNSENNFTLSIDKTTFDCNDVGANTVTLTVTNTFGLTSTCTATVNVSNYTGPFTVDTLEAVESYCSYSVVPPVINYLCGQQITGTSETYSEGDIINSSTTITWTFDNGENTTTSTQAINLTTPSVPTSVAVSSITETSARVDWNATNDGPYKIQYRYKDSSNTWLEVTTTNTFITLSGLDNGTEYEVKVGFDASCEQNSSLLYFETAQFSYCTGTNLSNDNNYYISNTTIGTINNTTNSSGNRYTYFGGTSTTVAAGETLSGTINYVKSNSGDVGLTIWIDYNQDGDFEDVNEKIYTDFNTSNGTSVSRSFSVSVPTNAVTGKTRLRVAINKDQEPVTSCDFSGDPGDIEDYDIYIDPRDTSLFEIAMITQVYHSSTGERWIEVTNQGAATIPSGTLTLGLFQNKTGDQTGVEPTAVYTILTALTQGQSTLIKSSGSSLLATGTVNAGLTDFDGANDIIAIVSESGTTAWENRFDVISNISNNTSYVRNDNILSYNKTYTSSEWTAFVSDDLVAYVQRHANAPLLSQVTSANTNNIDANIKLGTHYFGSTTRTANAWNNGIPDRSRYVIISENYEHTGTTLSARKLDVTGSYKLTVTNQLLAITNNININSTAQVRLAGTSQLVQTHTGAKQVSATGKILIDQNSTQASIYRFNYFSSPVNSINKTTFTLADVLKDGTIPTSSESSIVNINFVSGYNGAATTPISIANYWIYTYPTNTGSEEGYIQKGSTGAIPQTDGFLLKGTGVAQNYTFAGVPKDGTLTSTVGGYHTYLVGNPYPSAISANKFIKDNINSISGTLYFWQHNGEKNATGEAGHNYAGYVGGYATRNLVMGVSADQVQSNNNESNGTPTLGDGAYAEPKAFIPVGQGFFIQGDEDGGTVTFNNSQREYIIEGAQSVFFKTAENPTYLTTARTASTKAYKTISSEDEVPIIKLGMNFKNDDNENLHRQIGISFIEGNTFAYDNGYDSPSYNEGSTDIYWKFAGDEDKYSIAGVQQISNDLEVPLEIVMGYDGEVTVKIDEWQSINRDVYLKDIESHTATKINGNTATLNLTQNTYNNRFYLAFNDNGSLSTGDVSVYKMDITYQVGLNDILIKNTENVKIYKVDVYSIVGQQIKSWSAFDNNTELSLNLGDIAPNVYIVKVFTDRGVVKKKIVVRGQ